MATEHDQKTAAADGETPFGDEQRRSEIVRRYNPTGGGGPAARYDINFLLAAIDRRDAHAADLAVSLAAERARAAEATTRAGDAYRQLYDIAHGLQEDGVGSMAMAYETAAGLVKGVLLALGADAPVEGVTE